MIRVGMIGLDTSHVTEFTKIFRDRSDGDFADLQVVVGYPGGTDIAVSRDRVDRFTAQIRELGVTIVDSIPELLQQVDCALLESVDGTVHLEQVIPVFRAGKPVFIDKPIAGSLADAMAIAQLSKDYQVPCFSSSCIRFCPNLNRLLDLRESGGINGALTWGPCQVQPNVPDLFFYGIHGVEGLFHLMGRGCVSVQRTRTVDTDLVTGIWADGRVGCFRGDRTGKIKFGATVFGDQDTVMIEMTVAYRELCCQIAEFFRTGVAPVTLDETIEIIAFMDAADESARRGGTSVDLSDVSATAAVAAEQCLRRLEQDLPGDGPQFN